MRVISRRRIREFVEENRNAGTPLNTWFATIKAAHCGNPAELKSLFAAVDFVGDRTVFDIGGNKYRLIAYVHYRRQIVFIKSILTHKEYDRGGWK